jgi:hypothetical protein
MLVLLLAVTLPGTAALASVPAGPESGPALLCRGAIAATEAATRIPDAFLSAIGRVESGRMLPDTGLVAPWPWTVNAAGAGHFYPSKAAAIQAVQQFQASGIRSLDVGCLQVNIMYHPDAFASLEQAFDPLANATYAARLLMSLHDQTGSWPRAAAAYHSQTPALGDAYQQRVLAAWAEPDRATAGAGADKPASRRAAGRTGAAPQPAPPAALASLPDGGSFTRALRLPAAPGMVGASGRSLAMYRAMPVQMAARAPAVVIAHY